MHLALAIPSLLNPWAPLTVNLDKWNSLTAEQQAIIQEAMEEAKVYADEVLQQNWESLVADIEEAGGSILLNKGRNQALLMLMLLNRRS